MMTHEDRNSFEDRLAAFLLRRYASESPAPRPRGGLPDANDLAACAHRNLLPEQRIRIEAALEDDPGLRAAVEFERSHAAASPLRRRLDRRVLAAAAAVLIVALASWWGVARGPAADQPPLRIAELDHSVLAPAGLGDCAVLGESEISALEIRNTVTLRAEGSGPAPAVLRPSGLVLDRRPTVAIRPATEPARLLVFRSRDQETVFEMRVAGSPGASVLRIPFPDSAATLEPRIRYGAELRRPDGKLLGSSDFMVAGDALSDLCRERRAALDAADIEPGLASAAIANLYLRNELFADALEALRAVPEARRDAHWSRLVALTESELAR
jgi:hypothetical protein